MDASTATGLPDRVDDILAHFGIKGMHWGQRKAARAEKIRSTSSEDALNAAGASAKIKKTGLHSLSNKELQDLVSRINLEQQFSKIAPQSKKSKAAKTSAKFLGTVLADIGKQHVRQVITDQTKKLAGELIKLKK